jgi:hypothetical protein
MVNALESTLEWTKGDVIVNFGIRVPYTVFVFGVGLSTLWHEVQYRCQNVQYFNYIDIRQSSI